ncbi:hypothetical protein F511_19656 [Dorcoceras hygrometricum]|uniref:BHLH domain-containing protein n=1 Tax=Dorcoceras hygrometricum TaxID=472368 RepID=A0A2Z7B7F8_9LAMI|nr:hypothetical protein F511_19656 [Dorcoceras hygrometricum]
MFSVNPANFYDHLGNCSGSYDSILQRVPLSSSPPLTEDNRLNELDHSPDSTEEAKAAAASNSHKEAERRRRKRINGHIATLKAILPNVHKTDKASLLGEAVRRVKELRQAATEEYSTPIDDQTNDEAAIFPTETDELRARDDARLDPGPELGDQTNDEAAIFPTETDELRVCPCEGDSGLIKATLCCEDRPEMMLDLIQALNSVKAKVMRAEMCTVGGRTRNILWVELVSSNVGSERDLGLGKLRQVLKTVVDKSTLLAGSGQFLPGSKRHRLWKMDAL